MLAEVVSLGVGTVGLGVLGTPWWTTNSAHKLIHVQVEKDDIKESVIG